MYDSIELPPPPSLECFKLSCNQRQKRITVAKRAAPTKSRVVPTLSLTGDNVNVQSRFTLRIRDDYSLFIIHIGSLNYILHECKFSILDFSKVSLLSYAFFVMFCFVFIM